MSILVLPTSPALSARSTYSAIMSDNQQHCVSIETRHSCAPLPCGMRALKVGACFHSASIEVTLLDNDSEGHEPSVLPGRCPSHIELEACFQF